MSSDIAIVGIGCRFAGGVGSPEQLWELLAQGRDAGAPFPSDRGWDPATPSATRRGGFLRDADTFDAAFFGIAPREAVAMDPQQRLALEVAWEAVERAGVDPSRLRGTGTGVYLGATALDYGPRMFEPVEGIKGYAMTGTMVSVVSGRVAYALGLEGPTMTVDTACSSSLVALHLAVRALRSGECDGALAGGVMVMSMPGPFVDFSRQRGLAPDGRCKAFADDADGTAWGEGVGVLYLRRLSDALAEGAPVLAVVRGSATNADGASPTLTAPSADAQRKVITAALADAGLAPADIDLVEAHGTGTRLGDPIEARALAAVHGDRDRPLLLGSVKSNLGHTGAAAGVAGVIKAVLALRHRTLPPTINVATPTSRVDWTNLRLATEPAPLPRERPVRAGVSAFGISGTNAHVVLESPPQQAPAVVGPVPDGAPLLISARTPEALRAQAAGLADRAGEPALAPALALTRTAFEHRAAVFDAAGIAALARGEVPADGTVGSVVPSRDGTVFVFPGQGAQWLGMALELAGSSPVFAAALDECAAAIAEFAPWRLRDVLGDPEALRRDDVVQPMLFAVMVSLARLWRAHGVEPAAVVGHSQGEIAAACVAGALSLRDAARVVVLRSRLLTHLAGSGSMVSVALPADEVAAILPDGACVAVLNSGQSTVVAGDDLGGLVAECERRGVRARVLPVNYASHSPHVEPIRTALLAALVEIQPRAAEIPFYSAVTGGLLDTTALDGGYWYRNLREPVRFADATRALLARGFRRFVEPSAHPVLTTAVQETAAAAGARVAALGTLRRDEGGHRAFLRALADAHVHGVPVDWAAVFPPARLDLPTYPFQRVRYWHGADPLDGWTYRVTWQQVPETAVPVLRGRWRIVAPDGCDTAPIAAALAVRGAELGGDAEHILAVDPTPAEVVELVRTTDARLWVATTGLDPRRAQVWGLGRAVGAEQPQRWGGLVELPAELTPRVVAALCSVLGGDEDQVSISADGVRARRLERTAFRGGTSWAGARVLITGGSGALAGHATRWLLGQDAAEVVLVSRSGGGPAGPRVTAVKADVTDRDQLAAVIAEHRPTAVIHTAGVLDDCLVHDLTAERVEAVLAPKAHAADLLDELTRDLDLTAFVLFSSVSGVLGNAGQAAYGAANAHLDALAAARRAAGLPATSIAWGGWAGGGLVDDRAAAGLRLIGTALMDPERAVRALAADTDVVVADIDWATMPATRMSAAIPEAARPGPALADLPPAERATTVAGLVRTHAAAVLKLPSPADVRADRAFMDLGFDSLTGVDLRNRLTAATGLALPATLVFDHPTPAELAEHLVRLLGEQGPEPTQPSNPGATGADSDDPVVIVAMACRYPGGVETPEALWRLVVDRRDATGDLPADRGWDLAALRTSSTAQRGGFLYGAGEFDAGFFGISPREATAMDPQQRLALEVCWEAVERAGIDPTALRGSRTGTFLGCASVDYGTGRAAPAESETGQLLTGSFPSVISGRVAYTLGLHGPALTIDTACSSSLSAIHLAAAAVRAGECDLAIAGGVTVMPSSRPFVGMSQTGALSPDGRCKAFAAEADGMGMAEGAGVVIVERRSAARRLGHPVLAVIRGSAMNSDGASNGLTAPSGAAQQRVIRDALAAAGLGTSDVDLVEAHGTGTALGDPIEAGALVATYGRRTGAPLLLGSLKSNIGHTAAAAGVGGVIKAVSALAAGIVPATLHAERPTPEVDWHGVEVVTRERPWPAVDRPRRAAVSSFGISGSNVHLVLEAVTEEPAEAPETTVAWPLSARTPEALRAQARRLRAFPGRPADIAHALAARSAFEHRAVVVGRARAEIDARLDALAAGEPAPGLVTGTAGRPGVAFVFPGQGAQWPGMGLALAAECPEFAAALDECGDALAEFVDWDLRTALAGPLTRIDVVQPALFAVMVALGRQWLAWGVRPAAILGASQGEVAAACVAGALSVRDAAKVIALRSQALRRVAGAGAMAAVRLPEAAVRAAIARWPGLDVAAVNGPQATVVAGDPASVAEFLAEHPDGRRIPVDYASHSPAMEPLRADLLAALADIRPRPAEIPVHSTVTGGPIDTTVMDAEYWYRNLRSTVRLADTARDCGAGLFIEISPHPVLTLGLQDLVDTAVIGTLRRDDGGRERMLTALAEAHVHGAAPDWRAVSGVDGPPRVAAPTYPFQRKRYWLPERAPANATGHTFATARVDLADGGLLLTARVDPTAHPWLDGHEIDGAPVLPASVLLDLALHAADGGRVAELVMHTAVPLRAAVDLQLAVAPDRAFTIHARTDTWFPCATGTLSPQPVPAKAALPPQSARSAAGEVRGARSSQPAEPAAGDRRDAVVPQAAQPAAGELRGVLAVDLPAGDFALHPVLIDAALRVQLTDPAARPFAFTEVSGATATGPLTLRTTGSGFTLEDAAGRLVVVIGGITCRGGAPAPPAEPQAVEAADRARQTLDLVRTHAAVVLGYPGKADIAPDRAFHDLGMASATAVELRNRLTAATGARLPATVVFDEPTPRKLAAAILAQLPLALVDR